VNAREGKGLIERMRNLEASGPGDLHLECNEFIVLWSTHLGSLCITEVIFIFVEQFSPWLSPLLLCNTFPCLCMHDQSGDGLPRFHVLARSLPACRF
jgi:hypothetical protein